MASNSTNSTGSYPWQVSNKTVFLYGISALSLIALADPFPRLAMMFVLILIAGVLLNHANDYADMLASVAPAGARIGGGLK